MFLHTYNVMFVHLCTMGEWIIPYLSRDQTQVVISLCIRSIYNAEDIS